MITSARIGILLLSGLLLTPLAGCGDDDGGSGNANVNWNVNGNLAATCPGTLDPAPAAGLQRTVGDGSASSCTEAALREALDAASASPTGGFVGFDCGGPATITVTAPLTVDGTVVLDGGDAITLSGGGATRILEAANYTDLTVQRITLADGETEESGAAILHPWYGRLRAIQVRFVNNRCTSRAGEIGGGAVFAGGLSEAIFSECTFEGNVASNGGGILNRGSTLTIVGSSFVGNRAEGTGDGQYGNGGGLYIDGMSYDDPGDLFLCGTVFSQNHANQHGSAVFSYFYEGSRSFVDQVLVEGNEFDGSPTGGAGGFYHEGVPLRLTNSTIAGNRSDQHAAGLFVGSGSVAVIESCTFANNAVPEVGAALFDGVSEVSLVSCTFLGNDADYGPAIFKGETATITVTNTIFASNTTPNAYSALACHETLIDGGGNLQWPETKPSGNPDTPCAAGVTFADPLLEALGDHGGPTPTAPPGAGSPAIDAAAGCPDLDQRGLPRVGACDVGACEAQ